MENVKYRRAKTGDIKSIQKVEREHYEGFCVDEKVLRNWIEKLADNFVLAEDNKKRVVGFIFFEYLKEPKALPFLHDVYKTHIQNGTYFYISEIGVLDEMGISLLRRLYKKAREKAAEDGVRFAIWLTGGKGKHDKMELEVLKREEFVKKEQVKNWEASPGIFISDHSLWMKKL